MQNLDKLLYLAGVSVDYFDYAGHYQVVPHETRIKILAAMGYPVDDQSEIDDLIFSLDGKPWQTWVRALNILAKGAPITLNFHPDEIDEQFSWIIRLEDQTVLHGHMVPASWPECGDYYIGPVRYSARAFNLPPLPPGYHRMDISMGEKVVRGEIVICPPTCYEASIAGERKWGITCQLYSLRSSRNWGIGDFLDLIELIDCAVPFGADMIGLNPLHALCCHSPDTISPYSPSDRRFYNPLYLAPELIAEYSRLLAASDTRLRPEIEQLCEITHVDYEKVGALKYALYEILYEEFLRTTSGDRSGSFKRFEEECGESLKNFCRYEVERNSYARKYRSDTGFFAYLQWLCASQLAYCQQYALEKGMKTGLVGDLAVGSVKDGNEVASNPDIYRQTATIGAPPDPFSSSGQDWGLPVMDPVSMRESHYRHFIQLLRANMGGYGAIRIDHVMSLMRLWWCLADSQNGQRSGAYVYYPLSDLLSLVKLESHRCRCQVIGEDLGVVAEEFRHRMQESGLLGNTLFYFEQHHNHYFKTPSEQREQAVLMITNHDVPTLKDWWDEGDIQRRFHLGVVVSEEELLQISHQRSAEKKYLLQLLADQGLLPESWFDGDCGKAFDFSLCEAVHRLCARSNSRWVLLQLEDLQLMAEPVNIPGTFREYPNWQRKQLGKTTEIFTSGEVVQLLNIFNRERSGEDA